MEGRETMKVIGIDENGNELVETINDGEDLKILSWGDATKWLSTLKPDEVDAIVELIELVFGKEANIEDINDYLGNDDIWE